MLNKSIIEYTLKQLKKQGADKSSCSLSNSEKQELNIEHGKMSLFRTTYNSSLSIETFLDGKKGSTSINKTDKESIDDAVSKVIELSKSSEADDCYGIAEHQPSQTFSCGSEESNLDVMYDSLSEFNKYVKFIFNNTELDDIIQYMNYI